MDLYESVYSKIVQLYRAQRTMPSLIEECCEAEGTGRILEIGRLGTTWLFISGTVKAILLLFCIV